MSTESTEQEIQPITENLWWVLPGKLAGVRKPTVDEIPQLQATGIGAIVSVMDDPSNLDVYEQFGIISLWLPTKGGAAPTHEQIERLQVFIDDQNLAGKGVAVHCTSGRRRTGTILAAYLIQSGLSYNEAMEIVLKTNPNVELREAQISFLKQLA